jgi:hypothetical protein
MPLNKHKLFKIKISEDGKFDFDKKVENEINTFLADSDNVYVNHSIAILTDSIEHFDEFKSVNKYILLSLIYKDLNDSANSLKKVSDKVRKVVTKSYEDDTIIQEPQIETDFDKAIKEINIKSVIQGVQGGRIPNYIARSKFKK